MASPPRLLVNAIEQRAAATPDSPWLLHANSTSWEQEGGFQTITWKQFAHAVNKAAFWLDVNIPVEGEGSERQRIAYLGPSDPRYYILMAAVAKSKRTVFIPDGRITSEGLDRILKEIQCCAWISTQDQASSVEGLKSYTLPSLEYFLPAEDGTALSYPYSESWEQAKEDIVLIIHTSGTTGNPKPIYIRNGYISVWDSWETIMSRHHPRQITFRHFIKARMLTTCPPQWLAGAAFSLFASSFVGLTTAILPPDMTYPLDPASIIRIVEHTEAQGILSPPSLIEDLHNDTGSAFLAKCKFVCWTGAGLDPAIGKQIAQHTRLFPVIGSTECGAYVSFESHDVTHWESYELVPETGARMQRVEDDLYELYYDRTPEHAWFQSGFYTSPHLDSICTAEIYSPVIDKDGFKRWVLRGRKDDLVKLSRLAKFHATHIEKAIAAHAGVKSVIVGGEGREVPYIIIEPKEQRVMGPAEEFLDEIYNAVIRDINARDNDEIQIPRELVMLADPALPFKRSAKMTIMRREVERTYQHHIDASYRAWEGKGKTR